jgi:aspartate/methionine/tyrosine aminotransferase
MVLSNKAQGLKLSGIREINELLQKIPDVIRLEFGEPDFDPPEHVKKAAIDAILQGKGKYVSSAGIPELRRAIVDKLKSENNINYDISEVVVTNGANGAIHYSLEAIVNEGEEVLIPDPGWANYEQAVKAIGAKPVFYPLYEEDNFEPRVDEIEKLITNKTKAIMINSPNNPTGAVYSRKTIEDIANLALQHNLFVHTDEVYEKFIYEEVSSENKHVSIASLNDEIKQKTLTINSLSKTYAMTGWRIGYVAGPQEIMSAIMKLISAEESCVNTISQYAAIAALRGPQDFTNRMIHAFSERRKFLIKGLSEVRGFKSFIPKGAFYLFVNVKELGMDSYSLAIKILKEAHVALVHGSAFGKNGEGYLRLSYAASIKDLEEAIKRLTNLFNR